LGVSELGPFLWLGPRGGGFKMFSPPGTNSAAEKVPLSVRTSNGLLAKGMLTKMAFKKPVERKESNHKED